MATCSDGAVISTPIPATQSEGPLLMETNSIWNGHSYGIDNVEITCKRKRSNKVHVCLPGDIICSIVIKMNPCLM